MSLIDRFDALAPFRVRSFRFQWPADLLTSWAFEMEMLVLGWYVLVTSDSVILLTAFGALGFLGTLVSPVFGMLGTSRAADHALLHAGLLRGTRGDHHDAWHE